MLGFPTPGTITMRSTRASTAQRRCSNGSIDSWPVSPLGNTFARSFSSIERAWPKARAWLSASVEILRSSAKRPSMAAFSRSIDVTSLSNWGSVIFPRVNCRSAIVRPESSSFSFDSSAAISSATLRRLPLSDSICFSNCRINAPGFARYSSISAQTTASNSVRRTGEATQGGRVLP